MDSTAEERLAAALADKPEGQGKLVEVEADDVSEVCGRVTANLEGDEAKQFNLVRQGSAAAPGLLVTVLADNLYFLLQLTGRE